MDLWVRVGLLVAWAAFLIAALVWWRRRHTSKRYSYSERAAVILQALRTTADLGVIYWSKSRKTFVRRVITPLELDGYSLRAFDHSEKDVRIFKVTRIREIAIVSKGSETHAVRSILPVVTPSSWAAIVLGAVAFGLLGFALLQTPTVPYAPVSPPAKFDFTEPKPVTPPTALTDADTEVTNDLPVEASIAPRSPARTVPIIGPDETWAVVVENSAGYETNQVAQVLIKHLRCSPYEAAVFAQDIHTRGYAPVWFGQWARAEEIRQALEGDDLVAHLSVTKEE